MFEYKSGFVWIENTEDYLNALEVKDWELVHFVPVPITDPSTDPLHVLILHRRLIPLEREAAHTDQVRRRKIG